MLRRARLGEFQLLRHRRNEATRVSLRLRPAGAGRTDMRREPIEVRKATLASILRKGRRAITLELLEIMQRYYFPIRA